MNIKRNCSLIIEKIKYYGLFTTIKKVVFKILDNFYKLIYYSCFRLFPIDPKKMLFESYGDLSDNSYAFFDYLNKHNYFQEHKAIWLVENVKEAKKKSKRLGWKNVFFASKTLGHFNRLFYFYFNAATAKYSFYDHGNCYEYIKKRKTQIVVNFWHGVAFKAKTNEKINKFIYPDIAISASDLGTEQLSDFCSIPKEYYVKLGFPRNDYLFDNNDICRPDEIKEIVNEYWHFEKYRKVIVWMPTFRKSNHFGLSEDYNINETGLPLIQNYEEYNNFNSFLCSKNILLVLKIHPLQVELPIFREKKSNIIILKDSELYKRDVHLYQFLKYTDALITDYSSVSFDYLCVNNPIIYTLDDYEQYKKSRGFIRSDVIAYLKGYHVYNTKELEESIIGLFGQDLYKTERNRIIPYFYEKFDGFACERIAKYLNLILD